MSENPMQIRTSQDWPTIEQSLLAHCKQVGYNADLQKMLRNLEKMITELNKAEVEARRRNNHKYLQPQIDKINTAIEQFEQWAMLLILSK
jgi:hypothetical protein